MQQVLDLISSMAEEGISIWVDHGQLRCRAAEGILTDAKIERLRERKAELIAALTDARLAETRTPAVRHASSGALAPLTFQQEWLWNRMQENPETNWGLTSASRMRGALNVDALRRSFSAVIKRHESLRTRIVLAEGIPKQEVDEADEFDLKVLDLMDAGAGDAESAAQCSVCELFSRQLDGANRTLIEVRLLRLAENDHVLAMAIGHLVADHVSLIILYRELWFCYREFIFGRLPTLPLLSLQYPAYASWQRATHPEWLQEHGIYWKKKLAGAQPIHWPIDGSAEEGKSAAGAALRVPLGETLSHAMHDRARQERSAPAVMILALYAAFVSCWCAQRDFVIAFSVTGRRSTEHIDTIGFFNHQMPLRVKLSGNETFLELLRVVAQEFTTSYEHLDCWRAYDLAPDLYAGACWLQWLPWPSSEAVGVPIPSEWEGSGYCPAVEPFPVTCPSKGGGAHRGGQLRIGFQFRETPDGVCGYGYYGGGPFTPERFSRALRRTFKHFVYSPQVRVDSLKDLRAQ